MGEQLTKTHGFLKVKPCPFFVHGFHGLDGFSSVCYGEIRDFRVIRVQRDR